MDHAHLRDTPQCLTEHHRRMLRLATGQLVYRKNRVITNNHMRLRESQRPYAKHTTPLATVARLSRLPASG